MDHNKVKITGKEVKFNSFLDYNEKNLGLEKLRAKYPKESEEQIYTRILGHKPTKDSLKTMEKAKWKN